MVQMTEYGPPNVLTYAPVSLPPVGLDEVRLKTIASAVNHTDLEIRAGNWPVQRIQPFPYVPGVEVVGEVDALGDEVKNLRKGDRVITMMQGLGGVRAKRPGGYAEYVTVAANAVAIIPPEVDPLTMAAVGLVGVTAYEGFRLMRPLKGREILITGAAGGIGSLATAIARSEGALVIGVVSRPEQVAYVLSMGAHQVIVYQKEEPLEIKPASIDGVLDAVGGELFGSLVDALRDGGVLSLVGAVAGGEVHFDAWQLIRPVTLTGYSSEILDGPALRNAAAALVKGIVSGSIKVPETTLMPLAEASKAHSLLERGGFRGRLLLTP